MLGFCIKERTLRLPLPRTAGCSPLFPRAAGGGGGVGAAGPPLPNTPPRNGHRHDPELESPFLCGADL